MKIDLIQIKNQALRSAGFTLVEVLMCIAILSILFGTIYRTFDTFNRSYANENVKAGVQQKSRLGIDLMARDIRLAGLDPLGTPPPVLIQPIPILPAFSLAPISTMTVISTIPLKISFMP